jgi:hypothetical protein
VHLRLDKVALGAAFATRAMKDRDLVLAESLAGEEEGETRVIPARLARRLSQVSQKADEQREILEQATHDWEHLSLQAQSSFVQSAARRREEDSEELRSFINDLIQSGRRPDAGILLVNRESEPPNVPLDPQLLTLLPSEYFEGTPADVVTWYRDKLLSLHPAYLATRASLLERVTQLFMVTIRVERGGEIPQRRRYPLNFQNRG